MDDVSVDICESSGESVVVVGHSGVVDAEQVQQRGMEVVHGDGILGRLVSHVVTDAVVVTGLESGACRQSAQAI